MLIVFQYLAPIILLFSFLATLRIVFNRIFPVLMYSESLFLTIVAGKGWLIISFMLTAAFAGSFTRGELSPLPWVEFDHITKSGGLVEGAMGFVATLISDILLLFGTAEFIIQESNEKSEIRESEDYPTQLKLIEQVNRRHRLYFAINFLIGVLLMSKHNLLYSLTR